ncbi:IclR family transcriptional regulator [Cupriavidus taiwanensis]|uniref:IclR family transcriptional regulator n=1 Tax=Cupriavidus taiwanensis TaxID=164546 RepID=UPI0015745A8B|nr:IclR family transcriptional regulator [Cupriavidus taiwanensis]NSX15094.1 IclR family transcriptional regulator [Cupriavidus taiwanensis]
MTLKTLDGALALLTHFTVRQPTWGVRELAKHSGVHYAVVHRVLATFAANGFLVQDAATGKYSLGLRLFELGQVVRKSFSPDEIVRPVLEKLAAQSGETVFLSWLDGHEGLCVGLVHSQHQLRFSIELGERFPLYAGAHAKAMLAFQDEAFRDEVYRQGVARMGPHTTLERERIEQQLAEVRERGWAHTREEAAASVAGLALPLWSRDRSAVVGSVAIAGPQQRLDEAAVPRLLEALRDASCRLEDVIGFVR